ncbi:energy-coupling factor ABC transporter ATP-binding protein [Neptuniibacter sp. QD34_54]|uniref:energy-coupling factor ABC transporter ATP-binding protein n=1 Tax=Neptuniibacter sp. QD34_54 TaxID=3398208 RepID=UPI0039F61F0E
MSIELNASNLVKRFDQRELFNIDKLTLKEGESFHLSGDNGAGKTTLMKILAGLDKPCEGTVTVTPNKRSFLNTKLHPKVVYLHQTPYIFAGTVKDNIAYGLRLRGESRQKIKTLVDKGLAWSRLETLAEQQAHSLSGGEKQRLALARAWVLNPGLLFLDEPTANLDRKSVETVAELVKEMVDGGTTVMVSSHQSNCVTALCQRNLLLENGSIKETAQLNEANQYA